jgi:hypothetical protein
MSSGSVPGRARDSWQAGVPSQAGDRARVPGGRTIQPIDRVVARCRRPATAGLSGGGALAGEVRHLEWLLAATSRACRGGRHADIRYRDQAPTKGDRIYLVRQGGRASFPIPRPIEMEAFRAWSRRNSPSRPAARAAPLESVDEILPARVMVRTPMRSATPHRSLIGCRTNQSRRGHLKAATTAMLASKTFSQRFR